MEENRVFRKMKGNWTAFAAWLLMACGVHILLFREKVKMDVPAVHRIAMAILAVICVLAVHEFVHFIFMKWFYKGKVRLIFGRDKLGIPMPGVMAEGRAKKWQEMVMYLAPFVFLTLLPDLIFAFSAHVHLFFFIVTIGNCAGCYYDVMDVGMILNGEAR